MAGRQEHDLVFPAARSPVSLARSRRPLPERAGSAERRPGGLHASIVSRQSVVELQRQAGNAAVTAALRAPIGARPPPVRRPRPVRAQPPPTPASDLAVQRLHVSIPNAITNFRSQATPKGEKGGVTLTTTGQFYWTQLLSAELREAIAAAIPLEPSSGNPVIAATYFNWILSVVNQWPHHQAEYWAREIGRVLSVNERLMPTTFPTKATVTRIRSFLRPAPMSGKDAMAKGKAMYYLLWNQTNASNSVAGLARFASLPSLEAIWTWENQACGFTGSMVTDRFVRAGGAKAVNPDAKRRKSTATWAKFASSATRDMCPDAAGMRRGDVLAQRGVGAAIPRMKVALDDGWLLHARVLSGIDYGHGDNMKVGCRAKPIPLPAPPEEHSIMIIGYDGNEFAFWDPDSVSSRRHGAGFGSLFFDPGKDRLSTAATDAELPADANGNHVTGEHRYQVIHLGSQ